MQHVVHQDEPELKAARVAPSGAIDVAQPVVPMGEGTQIAEPCWVLSVLAPNLIHANKHGG